MSQTVSEILGEKHGISVRAGAKGECPFCHHATFSIRKDDTLGKCFHPSCGRHITPAQFEGGHGYRLAQVLDTVYRDFHGELLRLRDADGRNAYRYCVDDRGVHARVVADSMLGAIPPGYDATRLFRPWLEELHAAAKAKDETRKGPGRPKKAQGPTPEDRITFVKKVQDKLAACLSGHAGWLCFFYTDASHRIVAIRFREPYSKRILFFKPTKIGGVFGHGLFTPYVSAELRPLNDYLIVTEGEFNQLQLQSLCARKAEADGGAPETGYVNACAVGGVRNVDVGTVRRLARVPIVAYDHDASGAGFALVQGLLREVTVMAFTTPKPDSDLDDFIRGFGADVQGAHRAVQALISGRRLLRAALRGRPARDRRASAPGEQRPGCAEEV